MTLITRYRCHKDNYQSQIKRSLKDIIAVVVHGTGNIGDTSKNNAIYFSRKHTPPASAHYFVDPAGKVAKSVPISYTAYSVGGKFANAPYYGHLTNSNTVSIELCDIQDKEPSKKQIAATKKLIKRIKRRCKNCNLIVRHYDVNGKHCPARFLGTKRWQNFLKKIS